MLTLAFLGNLGFQEMLVILFVGLLLFGSKLPDVGRSLGKSVTEFKKGLRGMQDEMGQIERDVDRRVDEELKKREPEHATRPDAMAAAEGDASAAESASVEAAPTDGATAAPPDDSVARGRTSPPPHNSNG